MSALHHIELWVPDLAATRRSWGWLLGELGWDLDEFGPTSFALSRDEGRSWTRIACFCARPRNLRPPPRPLPARNRGSFRKS